MSPAQSCWIRPASGCSPMKLLYWFDAMMTHDPNVAEGLVQLE
jgi:hypothetical protein